MSVVLDSTRKVIEVLTDPNQVPKTIEHDRGVNLLFKLFLPFLDDYLYEESHYAQNITKKYIDDWVTFLFVYIYVCYSIPLFV